MDKLFVNINMFTLNQRVLLVRDNSATVIASPPLDQMREVLDAALDQYKVSEINFAGNENYIKEFILYTLKTKYSDRNVRILVNGKILN